MHSFRLFLNSLCFLLLGVSGFAQIGGRYLIYGQSKQLIYGQPKLIVSVSSGLDVVYNDDLNRWLSKSGVDVSDHVALNYLFKVVYAGAGKSVYGLDAKIIRTKRPVKSDFYFAFSYGRVFKLGGIHLIPLLGVGMSTEVIDLLFTVPSQLAQLNTPGTKLVERELVIQPSIMIHKHIPHSTLGAGLELGCRIYQFPSTWTYDGIKVPEVPNSSVFHPYFSIYFGYDIPKKK
jgi:hypothetical protein